LKIGINIISSVLLSRHDTILHQFSFECIKDYPSRLCISWPCPTVKDDTKATHACNHTRACQSYLDQVTIAKYDEKYTFSSDDIEQATVSQMKMAHPIKLDYANALGWIKKERIECYGFIFEADQ
jgi:hypothetical protein